ncbi:hypothetical protein JTE90_023804 [Oedothorax gibbosus]|uniref:Uncharacterized protein n=1 Tax=Oedothorax gibbosus TaxID=931172 RepID=A0AAV6VKN3_9ARAC|nr:hypothetical protein JTE90_023804 [Oedothorax gibbosus]
MQACEPMRLRSNIQGCELAAEYNYITKARHNFVIDTDLDGKICIGLCKVGLEKLRSPERRPRSGLWETGGWQAIARSGQWNCAAIPGVGER